ncbi:MAG: hypothetical protein JO219_01375 [Candidatus Eremiobacteraeota bacterium]|nr:hypothetical protein [Candidatus Eremiobacteraeota bacterium]MBV8366963.1 hypothetical protein [Candidatus Eremiobacteraeota bacterium]
MIVAAIIGVGVAASASSCGSSSAHVSKNASQDSVAASPLIAQAVTIDFEETGGVGELRTSGLFGNYSVDPEKFSFTATPHGRRTPARTLRVALGKPILVEFAGLPQYQVETDYRIPVRFEPPDPPGMYDVELHVAKDFGRTSDGAPLEWLHPETSWPVYVWWPDIRTDFALADAKNRFVGKNVFGYGGIAIGCSSQWFRTYYPTTPIRVKSVIRDRKRLAVLWTGSTVHWGNEAALHFFANDPLRFIVDLPKEKPAGEGGSSAPINNNPCPSIVLADWQVDLTLSTVAPPPLPSDFGASQAIRVGMSRSEVAWRKGYPNEFGEKSALDRNETWHYRDSLLDDYSVTFRNGKVNAFTTGGMPP